MSFLLHERWHGDEATGALFALRYWRPWSPAEPSPEADFVVGLIEDLARRDVVDPPSVPPERRHRLYDVVTELDRQIRRCLAADDWDKHPDARELRHLAWHLTVAVDGDRAVVVPSSAR